MKTTASVLDQLPAPRAVVVLIPPIHREVHEPAVIERILFYVGHGRVDAHLLQRRAAIERSIPDARNSLGNDAYPAVDQRIPDQQSLPILIEQSPAIRREEPVPLVHIEQSVHAAVERPEIDPLHGSRYADTFDEGDVQSSLKHFDDTVKMIETNVQSEMRNSKDVMSHWKGTPKEENCTACDAKTFCPYAKDSYPPTVP